MSKATEAMYEAVERAIEYGEYAAFFDGACTPKNPNGTMGMGAVIYKNGKVVYEYSDYILKNPNNTNNVAEHLAVQAVLKWFVKEGVKDLSGIVVMGDSMLVVNQLNGYWKIKKGKYETAAKDNIILLQMFDKPPVFMWIPRELKDYADDLSTRSIPKEFI